MPSTENTIRYINYFTKKQKYDCDIDMIINTPHMKHVKVSPDGNYLEYVSSYKYLGFCIHEVNDDQEIKKQLRSLIYRSKCPN